MAKKKNADETVDIANEAREGFDLRQRLAGANNLTKTVTVYTDAAIGAELGQAVDEVIGENIRTGRRVRKGLIGELDELKDRAESLTRQMTAEEAAGLEPSESLVAEAADIQKQVKTIGPKVSALRKKLDASAMIFTLRSLPDVIIRGVNRSTRQTLGIKGKGIPEARQEDYSLEYTAQMLAASVVSWKDNQSGESHTLLTVQQAHDLADYLPRGQFPRLDVAMAELHYDSQIADQSTDSADF